MQQTGKLTDVMHVGVNICLLVPLLLLLSACATESQYKSPAQIAYDSCTDHYNEKRASLDSAWAFAAGINGPDGVCAWNWGKPNVKAATDQALEDCRNYRTGYQCYIFATSDGLSDWVRKISDNGGRDGSAKKPLSPDCKLALLKSGLNLLGTIAAAANHNTYNDQDVDANACNDQ